MVLSICKYDMVLPRDKENFENFEEFNNWVGRAIKLHQCIAATPELVDLFETMYNLDSEVYLTMLKKYKLDYNLFRKKAIYINKVLKESDNILNDLGNLIEIFKIKGSVVSRMISEKLNDSLSYEEMKAKALALVSDDEVISLIKENFKLRTEPYINTPCIKDYVDIDSSDEKIIEDLNIYIKRKFNNKLTYNEKKANNGYMHTLYSETSKKLKRRR